jgi:hypothetical protein
MRHFVLQQLDGERSSFMRAKFHHLRSYGSVGYSRTCSRGAGQPHARIPKLDAPVTSATFARTENSLYHHYEDNAALIPAAQPTHPPAVDLISQPSLSEKS